MEYKLQFTSVYDYSTKGTSRIVTDLGLDLHEWLVYYIDVSQLDAFGITSPMMTLKCRCGCLNIASSLVPPEEASILFLLLLECLHNIFLV